MSDRLYNVLFLCTHNSARSVIAECVMNRLGAGKFKAYSAGSQPRGKVHPFALELLQRIVIDARGVRGHPARLGRCRDRFSNRVRLDHANDQHVRISASVAQLLEIAIPANRDRRRHPSIELTPELLGNRHLHRLRPQLADRI